jgi:hypothetical protein
MNAAQRGAGVSGVLARRMSRRQATRMNHAASWHLVV